VNVRAPLVLAAELAPAMAVTALDADDREMAFRRVTPTHPALRTAGSDVRANSGETTAMGGVFCSDEHRGRAFLRDADLLHVFR
jgi:hypothetical protein